MATDDLTPAQIKAHGMDHGDVAVRNVLAQAMDYAAEGGTVDTLMDDMVTPFWEVFIGALDAAGYAITPNAERQRELDVEEAIRHSEQSAARTAAQR